MTTGLDDLHRRILAIQEDGAESERKKILDTLLKERDRLLETWHGRPEYVHGLEHAIHLIGGDEVLD